MSDQVVWFEVMGQDAATLKAFYGGMFGWTLGFDNPMRYSMIKNDKDIGGGVGLREGPGWSTFYLAVEDIRAQVKQAEALGGTVRAPVEAMPDGALIAVVSDPEGNAIGLYQAAPASA